jgi:hypothetical protein
MAALLAPYQVDAASLQHKWQAGQQLNYVVALDGTVTVELDPTVPFLLAGIPIDGKVNGEADMILDTREVADDGAATLALTVPRLTAKGSAWEQQATLAVKNDRATVTFNGQPWGKGFEVAWLTQPSFGVQISPQARIQKVVSLKSPAGTGEANPGLGNPEGTGVPNAGQAPNVMAGVPVNVAGLMRSMLLQLLPALWPNREVAPGESWSVESRLPVPAQKNMDGATAPKLEVMSLGKFDLTLQDEEEVEGRKAFRIAMTGQIDLDKSKAARLNDLAGAKARGNKFTNIGQKVSGDLWFDAAAGQLVKADLKLNGQMAGAVAVPSRDAIKSLPWNGAQTFDGTLKINLRSVSFAALPTP